MVEHVVSAGEVIYIPPFWSHATCNLDKVNLGVGGQGDVHPPVPDPPAEGEGYDPAFAQDEGGREKKFLAMQLAVLDNDDANLRALLGTCTVLLLENELFALRNDDLSPLLRY